MVRTQDRNKCQSIRTPNNGQENPGGPQLQQEGNEGESEPQKGRASRGRGEQPGEVQLTRNKTRGRGLHVEDAGKHHWAAKVKPAIAYHQTIYNVIKKKTLYFKTLVIWIYLS